MPGTDGYQVASFIKNNKKFEHIPVIVNSSMTTDAVRGKWIKLVLMDLLEKLISNFLELTKKLLLK